MVMPYRVLGFHGGHLSSDPTAPGMIGASRRTARFPPFTVDPGFSPQTPRCGCSVSPRFAQLRVLRLKCGSDSWVTKTVQPTELFKPSFCFREGKAIIRFSLREA